MPDQNEPFLFVSHHSSKLQTAAHVERALNAKGVKCWIAPRDVDPGDPFDRAVRKAIGETDAMLLLFCSKSEKSRHVKRELILADQLGKAIIPLRLERIDPGELSYHLADSQWIDWLEQRDDVIDRIAAKAREFHEQSPYEAEPNPSYLPAEDVGSDAVAPPIGRADAAPAHFAPVWAAPPRRRSLLWLWLLLAALVIGGGIALTLALLNRGADGPGPDALTDQWFAGTWSETRDCHEGYRFDAGGQITTPAGQQGEWSIRDGNTLVTDVLGNHQEVRLQRVGDREVQGPDGPIYRCF